MCFCLHNSVHNSDIQHFIINHISDQCNVISNVHPQVQLLNQLTFDLFCMCVGRDHGLSGLETKVIGQRSGLASHGHSGFDS